MSEVITDDVSLAAFLQQAVARYNTGDHVGAEAACRQALAHAPASFDALHLLGQLCYQAGRHDEADSYLREALQLRPDFAAAHRSLGLVQQALAAETDAVDSFRRAIELNPADAKALYHLGTLLLSRNQTDDAIEALSRAVALQDNYARAWYSLANAWRSQARLDRALECLRRAHAISPEDGDIELNLAIVLLASGEYREGFSRFERRFDVSEYDLPRYRFAQPRWDGSPLQGEALFLYGEQGFGDNLQFIRYVNEVPQDKQGRIIVECREPLKRLFARIPGIDLVVTPEEPKPAFDVHAPLLSLPHLLGSELETVPRRVPYLEVEQLQAPFTLPESDRLNVGLVWSGNPRQQRNVSRSMDARELETLLPLPHIRFYSLQKGVAHGTLADPTLAAHITDLDPWLADFADTAAIIHQLDLVITVCTSVAHLAGALGKPVWVMLSYAPSHIWMQGREDSPWYPTARLFRQATPGDWAGVLSRVRDALAGLRKGDPAL